MFLVFLLPFYQVCTPPSPSPSGRGEKWHFFIFAPFWPILTRSVSGMCAFVAFCGPFLCCLFCICAGRETSGSLFPVFAPLLGPSTDSGWAKRRSWFLAGGRPADVPGWEGRPWRQLRSHTKIMVGMGKAGWQGAGVIVPQGICDFSTNKHEEERGRFWMGAPSILREGEA